MCIIAELRLTCEAVTGTKINDHLLDVLFTLFDDNGKSQINCMCVRISYFITK